MLKNTKIAPEVMRAKKERGGYNKEQILLKTLKIIKSSFSTYFKKNILLMYCIQNVYKYRRFQY